MEDKEINCAEFLKALYSKCSPAYINLRFIPSLRLNQFISTNEIDFIPNITNAAPGENCYFAVATREDGDGTKEGIKEIPALWVDIDFKDIPEEEARETITNFQPQPTYVINSGGGLHLYWLLKHPADPDSIARVEDLLDRLVQHFKGDPASTDASRILRIPGTNNLKYDPVRRVYVTAQSDTECTLEDFEYLPKVACNAGTGNEEKIDYDKESEKKIKRLMTCKFLQHCDDDSIQLSEPEWYAMVSILSHSKIPGHVDLIHAISRRYPGYSKRETDEKILHASNASGPMTCSTIKELWNCREDCIVTSPIGLERMSSLDGPEEKRIEVIKMKGSGLDLISADDLIASNIPEPEWLWDGLLVKNGLSMVGAKPKVGKSIFSFNIAVCVSQGWKLLGRDTKEGPVAYIALEENQAEVKQHLIDILGEGEGLPNLYFHFGVVPEKLLAVARSIEEKGLALVVIDIFQKFFKVQDICAYAEITSALEPVMVIARKTGCHILIDHHDKKGLDLDTGDSLLGSTGLLGGVDTLIHIRRNGLEKNRIYRSLSRSSYARDLESVVVGLDTDGISLQELGFKSDMDIKNCQEEILEVLLDGKGLDISLEEKYIKARINRRTSIVQASLKRLCAEDKLIRVGKGAKGDPYIYAKSESVILREAREEQDKFIKRDIEKELSRQKKRDAKEKVRKAQNVIPGCFGNEKAPESNSSNKFESI